VGPVRRSREGTLERGKAQVEVARRSEDCPSPEQWSLLIGVPFAAALDPARSHESRLRNIVFTTYQALRCSSLVMLGRLLHEEGAWPDLARSVQRLRTPTIGGWFALGSAVRKRLQSVDLAPDNPVGLLADGWRSAWTEASVVGPQLPSINGRAPTSPLAALWWLRNREWAHGGMSREGVDDRTAATVDTYSGVLKELLAHLAPLADAALVAREGGRVVGLVGSSLDGVLAERSGAAGPSDEAPAVGCVAGDDHFDCTGLFAAWTPLDVRELDGGQGHERITALDGLGPQHLTHLGVLQTREADALGGGLRARLSECGLLDPAGGAAVGGLDDAWLWWAPGPPVGGVWWERDEEAALRASLMDQERVLVVGPAGSGKTTTLLRCAEALVERGELAGAVAVDAGEVSSIGSVLRAVEQREGLPLDSLGELASLRRVIAGPKDGRVLVVIEGLERLAQPEHLLARLSNPADGVDGVVFASTLSAAATERLRLGGGRIGASRPPPPGLSRWMQTELGRLDLEQASGLWAQATTAQSGLPPWADLPVATRSLLDTPRSIALAASSIASGVHGAWTNEALVEAWSRHVSARLPVATARLAEGAAALLVEGGALSSALDPLEFDQRWRGESKEDDRPSMGVWDTLNRAGLVRLGTTGGPEFADASVADAFLVGALESSSGDALTELVKTWEAAKRPVHSARLLGRLIARGLLRQSGGPFQSSGLLTATVRAARGDPAGLLLSASVASELLRSKPERLPAWFRLVMKSRKGVSGIPHRRLLAALPPLRDLLRTGAAGLVARLGDQIITGHVVPPGDELMADRRSVPAGWDAAVLAEIAELTLAAAERTSAQERPLEACCHHLITSRKAVRAASGGALEPTIALVTSLGRVAASQARRGKLAEALATLSEARELASAAVQSGWSPEEAAPTSARLLNVQARIAVAQDRPREAERCLREALQRREEAASGRPSPSATLRLASSVLRIARLELQHRRAELAEDGAARALDLVHTLRPSVALTTLEADAHGVLASAAERSGDLQRAEKHARLRLQAAQRRADADPGSLGGELPLVRAQRALAALLADGGEKRPAIHTAEAAKERCLRLRTSWGDSPPLAWELGRVTLLLARLHRRKRKRPASIALALESLEADLTARDTPRVKRLVAALEAASGPGRGAQEPEADLTDGLAPIAAAPAEPPQTLPANLASIPALARLDASEVAAWPAFADQTDYVALAERLRTSPGRAGTSAAAAAVIVALCADPAVFEELNHSPKHFKNTVTLLSLDGNRPRLFAPSQLAGLARILQKGTVPERTRPAWALLFSLWGELVKRPLPDDEILLAMAALDALGPQESALSFIEGSESRAIALNLGGDLVDGLHQYALRRPDDAERVGRWLLWDWASYWDSIEDVGEATRDALVRRMRRRREDVEPGQLARGLHAAVARFCRGGAPAPAAIAVALYARDTAADFGLSPAEACDRFGPWGHQTAEATELGLHLLREAGESSMLAQKDWLIARAVSGAFDSARFARLLPMLDTAGALELTVEGLLARGWERGPDPRLLALMSAHPEVSIPEAMLLATAERAVGSAAPKAFRQCWLRVEPVMGSCDVGWTEALQSALDRRGAWGSWLTEFAGRHTALAAPMSPTVLRLLATAWDLTATRELARGQDAGVASTRARELWRHLWAQAPDLSVARGLASALRRAATQLLSDGEPASAERDLAESLALLLPACRRCPEDRDLARETVLTAGRLAEVQRELGQIPNARATAESVRELAEWTGLVSRRERGRERGFGDDGFTTVLGANTAAFTQSWGLGGMRRSMGQPGAIDALGTLAELLKDPAPPDDPSD
jgi:hypothetical protein